MVDTVDCVYCGNLAYPQELVWNSEKGVWIRTYTCVSCLAPFGKTELYKNSTEVDEKYMDIKRLDRLWLLYQIHNILEDWEIDDTERFDSLRKLMETKRGTVLEFDGLDEAIMNYANQN